MILQQIHPLGSQLSLSLSLFAGVVHWHAIARLDAGQGESSRASLTEARIRKETEIGLGESQKVQLLTCILL